MNFTDPDGNLVIFINGFDSGDGGSADYWAGKDQMIMDILEYHIAMYLDGSPSKWWNLIFGDNTFDKRTAIGEGKGFIKGMET